MIVVATRTPSPARRTAELARLRMFLFATVVNPGPPCRSTTLVGSARPNETGEGNGGGLHAGLLSQTKVHQPSAALG